MHRNVDESSQNYPTAPRSPAAASRTATRRRVGGPRVVIQLPDVSLVHNNSTESINERVADHGPIDRASVERMAVERTPVEKSAAQRVPLEQKRGHESPLHRVATSVTTLVNQSPLDAIAEFSPPMPSPVKVEPTTKPVPPQFNPLLNRFHVAAWLSQPRVLLSGVIGLLVVCGILFILNSDSPEVAEETQPGIEITMPTTVAQQPAVQVPAASPADADSEAPRFMSGTASKASSRDAHSHGALSRDDSADRPWRQPPRTAQLPSRDAARQDDREPASRYGLGNDNLGMQTTPQGRLGKVTAQPEAASVYSRPNDQMPYDRQRMPEDDRYTTQPRPQADSPYGAAGNADLEQRYPDPRDQRQEPRISGRDAPRYTDREYSDREPVRDDYGYSAPPTGGTRPEFAIDSHDQPSYRPDRAGTVYPSANFDDRAAMDRGTVDRAAMDRDTMDRERDYRAPAPADERRYHDAPVEVEQPAGPAFPQASRRVWQDFLQPRDMQSEQTGMARLEYRVDSPVLGSRK